MQGTRSDPGVIPRVVRVSANDTAIDRCLTRIKQAMFDKKSSYNRYDISLSVSYMEIYKDEVYDLLVTRENVCRPSSRFSTVLIYEKSYQGSQATSARK